MTTWFFKRFVAVLFLAVLLVRPGLGQVRAAGDDSIIIPQNLLKLMHTPEVQRELKLTEQQISKLETLFIEIDGPWFRARNLPATEQYELIGKLETQLWNWMRQNLDKARVARAKQLAFRSQGARMLLNPEIQRAAGLDASQIASVQDTAGSTHEAEQKLMQVMQAGGSTEPLAKAVTAAIERENKLLQTLLSPSQKNNVVEQLGREFDTRSLKRIYPMAPELVPVAQWINSEPMTLASLRGKVVLLHFYAFQCHNCHANFDKYVQWHEKYKDKGVVVLGIQTPETKSESDPTLVRTAAKEKGLAFPILIDLESKNWDNWANTMWPTVYVIDQQGYLRHWWQGELNWKGAKGDETIEKLVDELLAEGQ